MTEKEVHSLEELAAVPAAKRPMVTAKAVVDIFDKNGKHKGQMTFTSEGIEDAASNSTQGHARKRD